MPDHVTTKPKPPPVPPTHAARQIAQPNMLLKNADTWQQNDNQATANKWKDGVMLVSMRNNDAPHYAHKHFNQLIDIESVAPPSHTKQPHPTPHRCVRNARAAPHPQQTQVQNKSQRLRLAAATGNRASTFIKRIDDY